MKRFLIGSVLLLALCAGAQAQTASAVVVSSCGTPPTTYVAGLPYAQTQDTTGKLCTTGGGGGSTTLTANSTATSGFTAGQLLYSDGSLLQASTGTTFDVTNGALTIGGATVTTTHPVLNLTQTWNAGGVAFTGIKLNVTNTASASTSLLEDLQVGGSSVWNVSKTGLATALGGLNAGSTSQFAVDGSGNISGPSARISGVYLNYAATGQIETGSGGFFCFSSTSAASGACDATMFRDGAGIIAQRVGTAAQSHRVANTWTDASNNEYGVFSWQIASNVLTIGATAVGTGTLRGVNIVGASLSVNGTAGVSCTAGTLNTVTAVVTNGIVTHC